MKPFEIAQEEVEHIVDGMGKGIDEKIKKAVIALRMAGVQTSASCEGHREWGCPYPWVEVYAPEQEESSWVKANETEREKVLALLKEFYAQHTGKYPLVLQNIGIYGGFRIQSFYWNQKVNPDYLESYQQEMDKFADFIIHKLQADS